MRAPQKSRSTVIVVLLVATLAMTAALAYEALQAARSHREVAENVLRDYSRFAAWELSRLGRDRLLNAVHQGLTDVQTALRRGRAQVNIGGSDGCGACGKGHPARSMFRMSFTDRELAVSGAPLSPALRKIVDAAVDEGLRKPDEFTCPALTIVSADGEPVVLVWRPLHDGRNRPIGIVGFVVGRAFVSEVFERLVSTSPLLPPSLAPATPDANRAITVRVGSPDGHELYASSAEWSPYAATSELTRDLGALSLAVALRPDAAEALVIGGLPRERLPLVIGLLTLTVCLVVVALVQLRRETELSRLRSDFVSGVSHELRTPLAQIRMFTETLLLGRVRSAGEGRRSLEIISRETQRLIQLVENVLLFSRGERRTPELVREPARLAPIVEDVVEGFAPLAAARRARIATMIDHTVIATVDAGAVRQILLNILDNAVKYGPEGQTVTVALALEGDVARLAVEDEGPGIDVRDANRVWQPFTRLAHRGTATGGAGIGLAIVRQLTELHGGTTRVERSNAGGARFVIDLPGARAEAPAVTAVA